jgi:hypothetical protein
MLILNVVTPMKVMFTAAKFTVVAITVTHSVTYKVVTLTTVVFTTETFSRDFTFTLVALTVDFGHKWLLYLLQRSVYGRAILVKTTEK